MTPPTRFLAARARGSFGDRVDRLAPYLTKVDPLADAVVSAMRDVGAAEIREQLDRALRLGVDRVVRPHASVVALFEQVDRVPPWVDWRALDKGGEVLLRSGYFGGLVLGLLSLPYGYASPGGNKPLAFSGRLTQQAPRRLTETGRFVQAVAMPGGVHRHADGFAITIKVRLMHAQVRRLLWDSGRWDESAWGEPINQHDMVATTMLFSVTVLDGLRKLGFRITKREADAYVQLWKYVGYLIGVELELLPTTEDEALSLGNLILATQAAPDEDSRALTQALISVGKTAAKTPAERRMAERMAPVTRTISRALMGDALADGLGVPKYKLPLLMPALRTTIGAFERLRERSHLLDAFAVVQGTDYWRTAIRKGLEGMPAEFAMPRALASDVN